MAITINGTTGIAGVDGSASTPAYQGNDTNTGIAFPAADTVTVATGGTEQMRVNSSGNVAVGTSTADGKLTVAVSDGSAIQKGVTIQGTAGAALGGYLGWQDAWSGDSYRGYRAAILGDVPSANAGRLRFYTASSSTLTQRMSISSSDVTFSSGVTVYFAGATSAAQIETGAISAAFMSGSGVLEFGSNTTSNRNIQEFYNPNGNVGKIATNGSSTAFTTSSDYRLKENVAPMTGALATVQQLNPVNWTWKADGSAGQGFIAHELQAVVPDCVAGEKDAVQTYVDDEGVKQTRPVYQGVDTSFLVATLTAAIKELSAKNDALEARIAALEVK